MEFIPMGCSLYDDNGTQESGVGRDGSEPTAARSDLRAATRHPASDDIREGTALPSIDDFRASAALPAIDDVPALDLCLPDMTVPARP